MSVYQKLIDVDNSAVQNTEKLTTTTVKQPEKDDTTIKETESRNSIPNLVCTACYRFVQDESSIRMNRIKSSEICPHWIYRVAILVQPSLFRKAQVVHEFTSACCRALCSYSEDQILEFGIECSCRCLAVGRYDSSMPVKYFRDRKFCSRCRKSGFVRDHSFKKCTNCCGTGGVCSRSSCFDFDCRGAAATMSTAVSTSSTVVTIPCHDCVNGIVVSKTRPLRECSSCVPNFLEFARNQCSQNNLYTA